MIYSKVIVILGQTATGKSGLAVKVARKLAVSGVESEIISADSRQVYKGLDIGTGKITEKEMKGIPHYLIDVVNPKYKFSVAEYKRLAEKKIEEIIARGKTPIIVGGTGFYIDAITRGIIFPIVPPNFSLRKKLALVDDRLLLLMLKKLDPIRAKNIDVKNKVRLIRAIEIAKHLGKVPKIKEVKPKYTFIKIGLALPYPKLQKNIEKRVKKMFKDGLLTEIRKLKKLGVTDKRLKELGFEYYRPTPEKVIQESIKYAKRQMTWFKRDKNIKWLDPSKSDILSNVVKIINN